MESSSKQETGAIDLLQRFVERANDILAKDNVSKSQLKIWSGAVRSHLKKIYGEEHIITKSMSPGVVPDQITPFEELKKRALHLEHYIKLVQQAGEDSFVQKRDFSQRIFIGHGQSPIWRELKDFLSERLSLPWDEFNREAVAGITTFERISTMLDSAMFAFLIMTSEDQHSDATTHARQNVVHEVGLFQGKLGPRKAIILLEEGCQEFSNIVGLSQIQFPRSNISAAFEKIRMVLEREGLV